MESFIYIELLSPESTLKDLKIFYINSSELLIVTSIDLILIVVITWLSAQTLANKLNNHTHTHTHTTNNVMKSPKWTNPICRLATQRQGLGFE